MTNGTDDMSQTIKEYLKDGLELACMYARGVPGGHLLEAVMVGGRVEHITGRVEGLTYRSLTYDVPCASLYEREIYETCGLSPIGNRDMRPLRYRTPWYHLPGVNAIPHNDMIGSGIFEIPVGPIHAGMIGPGHFRFSVAGEPILMMRTYLGYSRRGAEKLMETRASVDNTILTERVSGDNAVAHSLAYLQTVEQDAYVPERARYIRTILSELERIYNHLGTIGGVVSDAALPVAAARGNVLRENILRLNERICGHRQLRGILRIGGLSKDVSEAVLKDIEKEAMKVRFDTEELVDLIIRSPSFMDRVEIAGRLSYDDAVRLRTVGPVARASGVNRDVRKAHPYAAYDEVAADIPLCPSGDVYARLVVRKKEIIESVSIILQCINLIKDGQIRTEVRTKDGFSIGMTESPRGETIHCAHIEDGKITRYKIRDASFPNWPALECAVLGNIVPDFPIVNKSFDLSYSGNDL